MKGKFIVIEGLEGAGKSTAISVVVDELNKQGINDIQFTREPGGTPLAEKLRTLVKENDDNEPLTEKAELLLLYAARAQLVDNVIKPALAKGQWVIGDRHDLSSQAYQGGGRQLEPRLMKTLRDAILGDFYPDLTIYLDISPELGLKRASQRGKLDRFEQEPIEFFNRIRNSYLELVKGKPNIVTIDAAQSIENVSQDITIALQNWFSKQK